MDIIVKMRVKPGDTEVSKATINMHDDKGAELPGQLLLEGETAETNLMIPPGGYCVIREYERPLVYDREQHAAVPADLTPEDPIEAKKKAKDEAANKPHPEPLHGKDKTPESTKADYRNTIDTSTKK